MTSTRFRAALAFALSCALAFSIVPAAHAGELQKSDTLAGTGKAAAAGSTVTVHYTGWLYAPRAPGRHGAQFDSSVGGEPFTFRIGAGKVIKGWETGLIGMKAGGKRTLVVPAALGYGSRGAGPIPPNANLIFDITLLDVK
jgi:FKBP-type peptidyl-prolyl cis-trans isomerase FkpA